MEISKTGAQTVHPRTMTDTRSHYQSISTGSLLHRIHQYERWLADEHGDTSRMFYEDQISKMQTELINRKAEVKNESV